MPCDDTQFCCRAPPFLLHYRGARPHSVNHLRRPSAPRRPITGWPVKGSSVKRSGEQWRLRAHVAFFSYRWLAWLIAALALAVPNLGGGAVPRDAGLLLLIGVITVTATALAQSYVRLLRQRPALLALDLTACAAILWLSGSAVLPFLPYALGALVLPALIFGWRGALMAAAGFTALDSFGLALINPALGREHDAAALGVRLLVPLAFACAWALAGRLLPRDVGAARPWAAHPSAASDGAAQPARLAARQPLAPRLTGLSRAETPPGLPASLAATTPMLIARSGDEPHGEPPRRVLYDIPASPAISLAAALEQLAEAAARQSGHEVRAVIVGAARPLNAAQHALLLRVAQEALLNVQQHARANAALVTLTYEPRAATLTVQDDGVGLLDGTYERPGLHALRAVRYRLAELDGQLAVFEGEGGGLTLRATVPLE